MDIYIIAAMIIGLVATASGIARAQLPDTRKDEDAIRTIIGATTDAFSRHDAKAWVQHCTSDAELVTVRGESMKGVAQIEKGLATIFQTRGRNVTLKTLEVSVRFVRHSVDRVLSASRACWAARRAEAGLRPESD